MKLIWKIIAAILVWVIVALVVAFIGTLITTVAQVQIQTLGRFLKDNSGLIGFLAGAAYFIWGTLPARLES